MSENNYGMVDKNNNQFSSLTSLKTSPFLLDWVAAKQVLNLNQSYKKQFQQPFSKYMSSVPQTLVLTETLKKILVLIVHVLFTDSNINGWI